MIVGQAITVIGAGLVTRFDSHTSMAAWASFLVVAGIGMGIGMQLSYPAVQAVLRYVTIRLEIFPSVAA